MDASKELGRLGRLVNHNFKSPNRRIEVVLFTLFFIDPFFTLIEVVDSFKGSPHLAAARDIEVGEELTIDYGVMDREI